MSNKEYEYSALVYIGRFQPFHNGHYKQILDALKISEYVIVLLGSSQEQYTEKNPLTSDMRADIIRSNFSEELKYRIIFRPLKDFKDTDTWVIEAKHQVNTALETAGVAYDVFKGSRIGLIGVNKDSSSWYLREFPFWKFEGQTEPVLHNGKPISATDIREILYNKEDKLSEYSDVLSNVTIKKLKEFRDTSRFNIILSNKK